MVRRALLAAAACLSPAASLSAQAWCTPQKADTGFVAFTVIYLTMFLADIAGNILKLTLYRTGG